MGPDLLGVFAQTISGQELATPQDKILVAVSGGPDSMVLLHLFHRWGQCELGVFHLDHGFRANSRDEADFVRQTARQWGIPAHIEAYNVSDFLQRTGESKQQGARQVRYDLFERCAKTHGYTKVALGHHADDQAETVMMRFLRGSGLQGLAGIPIARDFYIRPLLFLTREQILQYCQAFDIQYCIDESNSQLVYDRNRIRHHLMPWLERHYQPNLRTQLARLAQVVNEDEQVLKELTADLLARHATGHLGQVLFSRQIFRNLSVGLQRRVLRGLIHQYLGHLRGIDFENIEVVREHANRNSTFELNLPHVLVIGSANDIIVGEFSTSQWVARELALPGTTTLGKYNITVQLWPMDQLPRRPHNAEDYDWREIAAPLFVRPRRAGDRIRLFGINRQKKVKDILIDAKVPVQLRDEIPIVADQEEILWVAGIKRSEKGRITASTQEVLRLIVTGPTSCHG